MFDIEAYDKWFKQAKHTLQSAKRDMDENDFDWACFKAQQSAEYGVKALLYGIGIEAWGHSITQLLKKLHDKGTSVSKLLTSARLLDRHYIPTRYANAHVQAPPIDFYDQETSKRAIKAAEKILTFVKGEVKKWKKD